jgi:hypothetical protein
MNTAIAEPETFFTDEQDAAPPIVLDRSTLERWGAICPHQAYHIDRKLVSSAGVDADVGNEVHAILAKAVAARHTEGWPASQLRQYIEEQAMASRPDLQPAVLAALRKTYSLVALFCFQANGPERSAEDILRYDGGQGRHAGQLAWDIIPAADDGSRGPVRITCELDLLMAGVSIEELEAIDFKSGWKWYTAGDVESSFQFQFYAALIFWNYPTVNRVRFRVWMTRDGVATSPVEFTRENLYAIGERLRSAVAIYLKYRDADAADDVPAWPAPTRCSICPAATQCIVAHSPERDVAANPARAVQQLVVFEAAAERLRETLSAVVRQTGRDIVCEDGTAFGTGKPVQPRAKPCAVYETPVTKAKFVEADIPF